MEVPPHPLTQWDYFQIYKEVVRLNGKTLKARDRGSVAEQLIGIQKGPGESPVKRIRK